MPKQSLNDSELSDASTCPAATALPDRSRRTWVKPTGISSTWWVTMTIGGASSSRRPATPSRASSRSRPPMSRPAHGSSSSSSSGAGHEGPGQQDLLAFALGEHPERALGDVLEPAAASRAERLGAVGLAVAVPPGLQGAVAGGDHDFLAVSHGHDHAGDAGRHGADQRSRRARTSVRPSRWPRTSTLPRVGWR